MADQTARVIVKVTIEMAHEQVLKLRCEVAYLRACFYYALGAGSFQLAARYWWIGRKTQRQLHRIARWV